MNYGTPSNQMRSFVSHSRRNNFSNGDLSRSHHSNSGTNFGSTTSPNFQPLSPSPSPRYASSPLFNLQRKARFSTPYSKQGCGSFNRSDLSSSSTSPNFQQQSPFPSPGCSSPLFNLQPKSRFSTPNSEQGSISYNRSSNLSRSSTSNKSYASTTSDSALSTSFNYSGNKGRNLFQNSSASECNPGHSPDIRLYVDPSMLEDPWKELMQKLEEKK